MEPLDTSNPYATLSLTLRTDAPQGVETPDALRWEGVPRAPFEALAARLAAPSLMGRVHRWAD